MTMVTLNKISAPAVEKMYLCLSYSHVNAFRFLNVSQSFKGLCFSSNAGGLACLRLKALL